MTPTTRTLHIALQDGFETEPVVVRVDEQQAYRREDVQTDYRISLADSFDVPVEEESVTVEVELPNRQLSSSVEVEVDTTPYLAVSYLDDELQWRTSTIPFGYV